MSTFSQIAYYTTASTDFAAYIIGGLQLHGDQQTLSTTVAEFSQLASEPVGSWKYRGDTLRVRTNARAIQINDQTFVIGGQTEPDR